MKVTVIGTGYVGLVAGACFADFGFDVTCIDKDESKVAALRAGTVPIYEPGLTEIVGRTQTNGNLHFVSAYQDAIPNADVIFIAVGTPTKDEGGSADISAVIAASEELAPLLRGRTVIATKSTVPIGTGQRLDALFRSAAPDADVAIVSNPEFLREGSAVRDFVEPDRVVIGAEADWAASTMRALYRPIEDRGIPVLVVDRATAEISKYAANSFLATKIAFINEVADLCEQAGGDVRSVADAIGLDTRIGNQFLKAGPGFGGSCFPKDTRAFVSSSERLGIRQRVVSAAVHANEARKLHLVQRVADACDGDLSNARVAVLGLAFKAGTDDLRESPSLFMVPELVRLADEVRAHDPVAMPVARDTFTGVHYGETVEECLDGADVAVILTDWPEYRELDPKMLAGTMRRNVIVDLRNMMDADTLEAHGVSVVGIGRREPVDAPVAHETSGLGQAAE
ncbi:UDP-glucose dehydrogenase family protein [Thalassobaculum salexigens]|uniref:UDP-glucose dehydrogenase family protein n=1 Tax=Thalassobaculum salexigens TaxID=455360 RepID=UPI00248E73B3|nr:UDP-glucose/GDP-mannose dehydrogenase family protein [Thalassobaculum salexigens]